MVEVAVVDLTTAQEQGLLAQVVWEVVDELDSMGHLFLSRLQAHRIQVAVVVVVVQQTHMSAQERRVVQVYSSFHFKQIICSISNGRYD
jgi:hypothetical protein